MIGYLMFLVITLFFGLFLFLSMWKRVPDDQLGFVERLGRPTGKIFQPGPAWILPFIERLQKVTREFSVSLPPQSAITADEIPIQLQASLDAEVNNPIEAFNTGVDWRTVLVGHLQILMKDGLEELDFDHLDESFPDWVSRMQDRLNERAKQMGVTIRSLKISNLSPRTRPQG